MVDLELKDNKHKGPASLRVPYAFNIKPKSMKKLLINN